ncbi:F-box/LRR-repeat protein At3g59190-like [Macadamia integrifolia]|uniref:F-box/LRR-repeat protein At3g59190-like n=1 Tax=Macadamia integrifolia TaxID=60698 RepID=UPI001C532D83|nr:F-box/LRR-repeat protein At3g59190-like [Macadamia integrifolia]XP_042477822.1 F-box/LRR-repeat protein At3g59190-like [Macadamia integrifolia]XP_042477823.1 F-box/LRR-repeat protein At3g59190-like [Macadamia integrifolia]
METTDQYPVPKRVKYDKAENPAEGEDKISNLPDTLLHHILSFLPTKYAVRTCILSKRWKYIWTSVTSLDFDDGFYDTEPGKKRVRAKVANFMNFVDKVLIQNASSLEKFHLKCGSSCDLNRINTWICAAMTRKVQQLCLLISVKQSLKLPHCLFTSEYLVKLELVGNFVLNVPSSICLSSLIILYLEKVTFVDDISVEQLFSSCQVLEFLTIDDCRWDNVTTFDFSIPTLNCLTIYHCNSTGHKIRFNLPALTVLTYAAYAPEEFIVDDLSSLYEASIGVELSEDQYKIKSSMHGDCVHALLEGVAHVKILDLDGDTMETLSFAAEHPYMPTFPNLKRLGLGVCKNYGWGMLPCLLECSPGLEVLQFYEGLVHSDGQRKFNWDSPQSVPYCLLSHLKSIEISEFEGHDQEFEVIKFLVNNASILERLVVNFRERRVDVEGQVKIGEKEELKVAEKFLDLQKGSAHCRIVIGTSFGSIFIKGLKG